MIICDWIFFFQIINGLLTRSPIFNASSIIRSRSSFGRFISTIKPSGCGAGSATPGVTAVVLHAFCGNPSSNLCSDAAAEVPGVTVGMARVHSSDISDRLLCIEYGTEDSCVPCGVSLGLDEST